MPGGHGGGRGKPMAQRSPAELWSETFLVTLLANLFVALPFVGLPKPGHAPIWPLFVIVVEVQFGVASVVVARQLAELSRRGNQVPAWVGRRPYLASFALINAVAAPVAATGLAVRAVVGWGG